MFERARMVDPEGLATPQSVAAAGQCFKVRANGGELTLSVGELRGVFWCFAAVAEGGQSMYRVADAVLCRLARLAGFERVGFQTARPGLVRRMSGMGYSVSSVMGQGFAMEKQL